MKILYVSQYFPPEIGAPAARVAELSALWAKEGHAVTVLTGFPNHPRGVVPKQYRKKLWRLIFRENWGDSKVVRSWLFPLPNRKSWERVLNYSSFSASASITGTFLPRPDVVIATSPQLLVGLAGLWLARWHRVPFIFEVRDLWPESLAAVGVDHGSGLLYRTLSAIARFLYRAADHIVVVTPSFKEHLVQNWHVLPEKISIIENGVDNHVFRPNQDVDNLRDKMEANGSVVVSYIGTIGVAHGLESLIQAAAILRTSAPNIAFWVVGEGAEKERMAALSRSLGLTSVRFVGQQPRELIPSYICASDICLVLLRDAELFRTVLPSKMLEFMACARPTIMTVDGYARKLIESADAGLFVRPDQPNELAAAIVHLAKDPLRRQKMGINGREFVTRNFSRASTAERYLEVLHTLLEPQEDLRTAVA